MRFYALRLYEAGMINSSPNADPRRRHRLALPERAQAGAEGVTMPAALALVPEARAGTTVHVPARTPRMSIEASFQAIGGPP